jgi:serine/threonine protein kinase
MVNRVGQQLGNYRLISLLGKGGFADVYLGKHVYLDTPAAIKVMNAQLATQDIESFRTEARILAQLIHPAIVRVLDFGMDGLTLFLVLDYAPNGTLRQRHPKGTRLPLSTIIGYVKQIAAGLQYAHERGLIHRDIKPENLLMGRNNEILLTDFGLAIMAPSSFSVAAEQIAGSVGYIAPEQILGKPRLASDQYSFGVIVYEWLSGSRPFEGSSFLEVATQHLNVPPPFLREKVPTILPAVEQVVLTALAKDPQQRFPSIQAFAMALEQACTSEQPVVVTLGEQRRQQPSPGTTSKTKEQWLAEGNASYDAQQFEEALRAYKQASLLDPTYAAAYVGKGLALRNLQRFEEALLAYERAIQLDPDDPVAYNNKSKVLSILQWYSEALKAANQAIELNPNYPAAYYNKGYALGELQRHEEELVAYERAIQLDPTFVLAYNGKGVTLNALQRYEEALAAFDRAIQLARTFAVAHVNRGDTLGALKRYEEALQAYNQAIQLDPNYATAYKNKSRTLEALGRTSEAQYSRQKAHELSS